MTKGMQKINLRLEYMINEKGVWHSNGKIGPNVDKTSTQFGRGGPEYKDGEIEESIMRHYRELKELYPDRPLIVKLTIQDDRK